MIELLKSGSQLPHVELKECGPSMDLVIRRTKFADPDLWKESTAVPKQLKKKKVKSIETGTNLKQTVATIHMGKQDLDKIATRKFKGTKRTRSQEDDSGSEEQEKSSKKHKETTEEAEDDAVEDGSESDHQMEE